MGKEDKQVIDMANCSGERRKQRARELAEALRCEENTRRRIQRQRAQRQRKVLLKLIPALVCILAALLILAAIASGWVGGEDAAWAAALAVVIAFAGGLRLAVAGRR